jgi:hypothetical protein
MAYTLLVLTVVLKSEQRERPILAHIPRNGHRRLPPRSSSANYRSPAKPISFLQLVNILGRSHNGTPIA